MELGLQHNPSDNFLKVMTISDLNRVIEDGKFVELIRLSEGYHDKRIVEIAQDIEDKGKRIILIAGPSSSGKTTFSKKLCTQLQVCGLNPLYMGTDDYFVEREQTPLLPSGEKNYEDLEAVDVELFNRNLNDLLDGKEVDLPEFDFITGHKTFGKRITKIEPNQPIVIEGIHALNDALTPSIKKSNKYKIFICPVTAISTDNDYGIGMHDHRMLRRMVRDYNTRGHSAQNTIDSWPKVRAGENRNIFPYVPEADVMFNSSNIYELAVLKKYAWPLLNEVKAEEPEYETAQRIAGFLKEFTTYEGDDSVIPSDSILREFIGGSLYRD